MEKEQYITGRMKFLESRNDKLQPVELWMLNELTNRNNWRYINIATKIESFKNIPILIAYEGKKVGAGHNMDERVDPKTGKPYMSFTAPNAERIVGWIDKDANVRIEKDEDGTEWVVGTGYIWKFYAKEALDFILQGDKNGAEISIETIVTKEHMEENVAVEEEYEILGVTVLGTGVMPAVAGARIHTLQKLEEYRVAMKNEIIKAASYINQKDEPNNDTKNETPKGVKHKMVSKRKLNAMTAKFEGFTCIGISDDDKRIALLSADNVPYGYTVMDTDNGTVIAERMCEAIPEMVFKFDDAEVTIDFESTFGALTEKAKSLEAERDALATDKKNLESQIEELKTRENKRRMDAAKYAMQDELAKRNAHRDDENKFSADICKDLEQRIANNEFTALEDAEGNWVGDKSVRDAVKALCMDEQTRMDEEAEKKHKHSFAWGMNNNASNKNPQTIGEKLAAE